MTAAPEIRVRVWSEHTARRAYYPDDINGAVAEGLRLDDGLSVTTAELVDEGDGVPETELARTDVLVWWGHQLHRYVADDAVDRVVRHVRERGMGFVALHSSHMSKPFTRLIGDDGGLGGVEVDAGAERITVEQRDHPVADGVDKIELAKEESYNEPFNCGKPDAVVFRSVFDNGHEFRSGLAYTVDNGRVFYFRPGHETYPAFADPMVRRVIRNAVYWTAKRT